MPNYEYAKSPNVDARARLVGPSLLIPWLVIAAVLGVQLLAPRLAEAYALVPLLLGVVFLGLPHGAFDHLLPARLGLAWGRRPLPLGLYLLAYVALAALYFGLWLRVPGLAFVGFLLLTVGHWGQGDGRFLELFLGRLRPTRWGALTTRLVRGALPVALPVLAFTETAESLYRHAALGLGVTRQLTLTPVWPLTLLLGLALAAYSVNAVRAAPDIFVLAVDVFELLLLTAFFTLVPAYLAVGVYFAFWHSLRHLACLLVLDVDAAEHLAAGRFMKPVRRLTLDLLPLTLAALALLGGLYLVSAARVVTLEGFVALYLVFVSALTLPHAVAVAVIWRPAPPRGPR